MSKRMLWLLALLVAVAFVAGAHLYNKNFHEAIRNKPEYYCYDYLSGVVNPAMIVTEESFIKDLVHYYQAIEKDPAATPYFNFPLKSLPQNEAVYLLGYYDKDSVVAEVYSYYTFGTWYRGHLRGYVYAKTLHETPPEVEEIQTDAFEGQ